MTRYSTVVRSLLRISDVKLSDKTLPVCPCTTATVHLNFQNSTENANAFVCSRPRICKIAEKSGSEDKFIDPNFGIC